jgi:phosphopantothenoylcysteine decarboxylase/phosphopantothenate--cysteine ligase
MTLAALSEQPVHTSLWDLKDEVEMGHIELSREADPRRRLPGHRRPHGEDGGGDRRRSRHHPLLATDKPVLARRR